MPTAAAEVYNSYYKRFRTVGAIVVKNLSVGVDSFPEFISCRSRVCLWVFGYLWQISVPLSLVILT